MSELHAHPLLEDFYPVDGQRWRIDKLLPEIGSVVRIFGAGEAPTQGQLDIAHRIARQLPRLLLGAALGKPPSDDVPADWETLLQKPSIRWISVAADGSATLGLNGYQDGQYYVAPQLELSPDLLVISASWGV
jgi:hypothetical protein